jgi:CheY-like chemotaxis protein
VLALLRDDPLTADIPVIALSANALPRDVRKGLDAGFLRYLTKPINVNEFMAALDLALAPPARIASAAGLVPSPSA